MKKLLMFAFSLMSLNSFSMEMQIESWGDRSVLFSYPSLGNDILISSKSSQNGICKALGFEKAAVGSMVVGSQYRGVLVIISDNGEPLSGEVSTSTSGQEVLKIVCVNKTSEFKFATYRIAPRHLDSKVPYSTKSDQVGVCRSLGFHFAAVGAMVYGEEYRGPMVVVNDAGQVVGGEVSTSTSGLMIKELVCVIIN